MDFIIAIAIAVIAAAVGFLIARITAKKPAGQNLCCQLSNGCFTGRSIRPEDKQRFEDNCERLGGTVVTGTNLKCESGRCVEA